MTHVKSLLFAIVLSVFGIGTASAACVVSGDTGGVLHVYDLPDNSSAIMGGIKVGECNVEVTTKCEGQWCFTRTGSLFGWIDTQHLDQKANAHNANNPGDSNPSGASASKLTYRVTGGGGVFNMLGIKQNTPVDPGGEITLTYKSNGNYVLNIAPITPDLIELSPSNGVWTGKMSNWAGQPMSVIVTGFKIGGEQASLKLAGKAPMGTLEMVLELALVSRVSQSQKAQDPPKESNSSSEPTVCARMEAIENQAKTAGNLFMQNKMDEIKRNLGMANGPRSNGGCVLIIEAYEREGIIADLEGLFGPESEWGAANNIVPKKGDPAVSLSAQKSQSQDLGGRDPACRNLRVELATIMRGNDEVRKSSLRDALRTQGIVDLGKASVEQCKNVMESIGVPIANGVGNGEQQNGAQNPVAKPQQGGEDPNTMIEGGKEITGSEADFEPANGDNAPASSNTQPASSSIPSDMCDLANDAIIEVVARGSIPEMRRASELLNQYNMRNVVNANLQDCQNLFATMELEGMVR